MKLEANNISFQYSRGTKEILYQIDLLIESGEWVGLIAPSGHGKTTLCKILSGYENPTKGKVLLDGKELDKKGYCPVQLLWQHPEIAIDPLMNMKDNMLEVGAEKTILEKLDIKEEWLKRYPNELSGGELQRFCIARVMGKETKFLLCDEITAMLDLITQSQIWHFLKEESIKRNLGVLVVSHSPELLEKLCSRNFKLNAVIE